MGVPLRDAGVRGLAVPELRAPGAPRLRLIPRVREAAKKVPPSVVPSLRP